MRRSDASVVATWTRAAASPSDRVTVPQGPEYLGVLGDGLRLGVLLDHATPDSRPHRPRGHARQHGGEGGIAGGGGDHRVEVAVRLDQNLLTFGGAHPAHQHLQFGQRVLIDPKCGKGGGGRFEDPTHLNQFQREPVGHELGRGADPVEQLLGTQAGHIGSVTASHVEHAGGDQTSHCLPDRVSRGPELDGQFGFGRKLGARYKGPGRNHLPDLAYRGLGQRRRH